MADSSQVGLLGIDPELLASIGMGLMSSAKFGGNVGDSMQQALGGYYTRKQAQQQLGMGRLQMQQLQQEMPLRMDYLKALGEQLHAANNSPEVAQQISGLMGSPSDDSAASTAPPASGLLGGAPAQPTIPSSVPTIPGAPQGFASAPPIQAAPIALRQAPPQASYAGAPGAPQGQNPFGMMDLAAFGGALGMPGAQQLTEAAKARLQYDPAIATRMKVAQDAVTIDQQMMRDAAARGDYTTAAMLQQKMAKDSSALDVQRGYRQWFDPRDGQWHSIDTSTGMQTVGNQVSLAPGAAQATQQRAAAQAYGQAQGELTEVTDKDGNVYRVPVSTLLGGSLPASAPPRAGSSVPAVPAPPAVPGAPGNLSGIGPQRSTLLTDQAKAATEANSEFQKQAEDSNLMLAQANELRASATDFTPGKFADTRGEILNFLNSTGLITPEEQKALGSYQAGTKIAIQLQAAVTKQLGSREAAQVFTYMGKSIPNLTLSPDGLEKILSWTEGMARYQQARAQVAQQRYNAGDVAGVNSTRDDFIKGSNPVYYILASANPAARGEMLASMPHSQQLLAQWAKAVKAGLAPAPNDYWTPSATQGQINRGGQ